jgi:hypothetical protein
LCAERVQASIGFAVNREKKVLKSFFVLPRKSAGIKPALQRAKRRGIPHSADSVPNDGLHLR